MHLSYAELKQRFCIAVLQGKPATMTIVYLGGGSFRYHDTMYLTISDAL